MRRATDGRNGTAGPSSCLRPALDSIRDDPEFEAVVGDTTRPACLPANAGGYAVYARITVKPGDDGQPTVTFNEGEFAYVEDEAGNYVNCQLPETPDSCPVDDVLVSATCDEYAEPTWVFNIADFVGYLWDLDTTGAFVVQLRFYPMK